MTGNERFGVWGLGAVAGLGVVRALQLERQVDGAEAAAAAWGARAISAEDELRQAGALVAQLRRQVTEAGPALGPDVLDVLALLVGLFS